MLLNRQPSLYETYNDLNHDLYNFFKVLREQKDELLEQLLFTPYSRQEFEESILEPTEEITDLEKARRFFVRARQSFNGKENDRNPGNWSHNTKITLFITSRPTNFINGIQKLTLIIDRLAKVKIENRPALYVIEKYDSPEALFYIDPPYLLSSRTEVNCYKYEMTAEDYAALAKALNGCEGKVALSAYECPYINDLFPAHKWFKTKDKPKLISGGVVRTETLYTNYNPFKSYNKRRLF